MMKLRPFELGMVIVFGVMGVFALILLSTYKPPVSLSESMFGSGVTIWGTLDSTAFYKMMRPLTESNNAFRTIVYVQKDSRTFDLDILNAMAEGTGPDIMLLPHEQLVTYRTKIQPIPYENFPMAIFREQYIDGAEIFALNDGVYAFPIAVDPLVMYWNRDTLSTYNFVQPPLTWESMVNEYVPTLVDRDFNRTIIRSPIAFGEYRNVTNAFPVLSMLLIQAGSALVQEGNKRYLINLNFLPANNGSPLTSALTFYTNFANPSNPLYTWNRTMSMDKQEFLGEKLVFYFGKGSEVSSLIAQNPNLNFGIAEVPQGAGATNRRTYGSFYGLALLKTSKNQAGAYTIMQEIGNAQNSKTYADALGFAPVHRSTLLTGSNDIYGKVIYSSAIVSRGWLSPAPAEVDSIFTEMVEDVLANRLKPESAAVDATNRLGNAY